MKAETAEWINKAEGDWASANREYRARKNQNYDAACFHAQQCIEKYLKALMVERSIQFPLIHDLAALALRLHPDDEGLAEYSEQLALLTSYAVAVRYPGTETDKSDAKDALHAAKILRELLRESLGVAKDDS